MTQRAVFRGFLVYLKRVLFACVLCVFFGSIAEAGSIVEPVVGSDDVIVKYECASYGGVQSISTSGYPNPVMLALNSNYSVNISLANNYCNPTNDWEAKWILCYKQSDGSNFVVETSGPIDTSTSDEYVCTIYYLPKGTNFAINEIYNCEGRLICSIYSIEDNAYLDYDDDAGPQNPVSTYADIEAACHFDENYITSCYAGLSIEACGNSGICNNAGNTLGHAATNSYNEWLNNMQYEHSRQYFPSYLDYHHAIRLNSPDADSGNHGTGFVWYCSETDVLDSNQLYYQQPNNCPINTLSSSSGGCYGQTPGLYPFVLNLGCCNLGCYKDPSTYPWRHPGYQVDYTQLLISSNNQNPNYSVEIPQRSGYVFLGYYDTPDGTAGTQYVDQVGKLTPDGLEATKDMVGSITTACGQWEAHWCPVGQTVNYSDGTCGSFETYTITLNKNGGTGGSSSVYSKYNVGVYLYNNNGTLSGQMLTSNSNAITLPTRSGYTFLGYYASTSSSAQQYINSNGKITQNGINAGKGYTSNDVWYAKWESNTCSSGTWWSDVTNQCEPGYKIELTTSCCGGDASAWWDIQPFPDKLYTIQNVGVYRDANRTELMVPQTNGEGGAYPITFPQAIVTYTLDTSNIPKNPETNTSYTLNYPTGYSDSFPFYIRGAHIGSNLPRKIDNNGYITDTGFADAIALMGDTEWDVNHACGSQQIPYNVPSITGYTGKWYDNSTGTGNPMYFIQDCEFHNRCTTCNKTGTVYANWTPITYTIQYDLNDGTHGANHPESATYDTEFTVSNPTRTGYTFAGWTITGMDGVTHYYSANPIISNDVYQGATTTTLTSLSNITDTHFMNLRSATGTVTFNAQWENDTYLLTYAINAPNGLSINEPSENPVSVNAGQNRPLVAVPTGVGYTCSQWNCGTSPDGNPVSVNNNTISEMPASNVLCTTSCRRNLVGLGWNTDDADNDTTVQNASPISCVYGTVDGIFPIQTPVKHGYTFVGWTISNWASGSQYNFLTLNTSDDGIERWAKAYSNSADYCWYDTNAHSASNVSCTGDSNFDELEQYQWKVKFGHGDVYGISRCSSTSGTNNETGNPLTNAGKYCWCMATGYKQSNSSALNGPATEMPWVMRYTGSNTSGCRENCAAYCSYHTEYTPDFRSVLYGL